MLIGPFLGDLFLYQREWNNFAVLFVVAALANILPAIGLFFLRPTDSEGTNSSLRLREFVKVARRHWPGMILLVDLTFGVCMSGPFIFVASFVDAPRCGRVVCLSLGFSFFAMLGWELPYGFHHVGCRIALGPERCCWWECFSWLPECSVSAWSARSIHG